MAKKNVSVTQTALEVQVFQLKRELEEQRQKYECKIKMLTKQHEKEIHDAVANAVVVTVGMLEERLELFRDEISSSNISDLEERIYRLECNLMPNPDDD